MPCHKYQSLRPWQPWPIDPIVSAKWFACAKVFEWEAAQELASGGVRGCSSKLCVCPAAKLNLKRTTNQKTRPCPCHSPSRSPRHSLNRSLCHRLWCVTSSSPISSVPHQEPTASKELKALSSTSVALFAFALLSGLHVPLVFVPQHKLG